MDANLRRALYKTIEDSAVISSPIVKIFGFNPAAEFSIDSYTVVTIGGNDYKFNISINKDGSYFVNQITYPGTATISFGVFDGKVYIKSGSGNITKVVARKEIKYGIIVDPIITSESEPVGISWVLIDSTATTQINNLVVNGNIKVGDSTGSSQDINGTMTINGQLNIDEITIDGYEISSTGDVVLKPAFNSDVVIAGHTNEQFVVKNNALTETFTINSGTGNITTIGDLNVNGGDIKTTSSTATVFNTNATSLNIGQAATAVEIGATTGVTSVNNNLAVDLGLTVTGEANLNGGLKLDTNKFTVADGTGNTYIDGTLELKGEANLNGGLKLDTNKFTVADGTGNTYIDGTLDVKGETNLNGGLKLDTNKFTVADGTGNTYIDGTLDVNGDTDLDTVRISETLAVTGISTFVGNINANGGIDVDDAFVVADGGALTTSQTITSTNSTASTSTSTGAIRVTGGAGIGGNINIGGTTTSTGAITSSNTVQGTRIISTVPTGTAPLTVTSTTKVTNLHADLLDGEEGADFHDWSKVTGKTTPIINLSGDLGGSVSLTTLGNGPFTLEATIQPDSVALGTDTTGNYVATIANANGLVVNNSGTETAAVTIALGTPSNISSSTGNTVTTESHTHSISSGTLTEASDKGLTISGTGKVLDSNLTIDLPQALKTTSEPTFAGLTVDNINVDGNTLTSTGNLIINSTTNSTTIQDNLSITGDIILTGDLAVNGGDITTTASSFNIAAQNATNVNIGSSGTTVNIPGNLIVTGTVTTENVETLSTSNGIVFEGTVADDNELTLKAGSLTADRTVLLPDRDGTIALLRTAGDSTDGTVTYNGTASSAGRFYGGSTNPSGNTRLNYAGDLYSTRVFDGANRVVAQTTTTGSGNAITSINKTNDTITFARDTTFLVEGTQSKDFGTITVSDTNSGYTWTETGAAVADINGDNLTLVSGVGINVNVDSTNDAILFLNTDRGSSQNIFKNIAVSGQTTIEADSNNDTLTVVSGDGVSLTTNAGTDTLTITNTDRGSSQNIFKNFAIDTDSGYTWGSSAQVADSNDDTLTLVAGGGISLSSSTITGTDAIRISHTDTSSATGISSDNNGNTFIQDISFTLDTYGHVTANTVGTSSVNFNIADNYAFKTVNVDGTNLISESNTDTLTVNPGNNISLSTNGKSFTISSPTVSTTQALPSAGDRYLVFVDDNSTNAGKSLETTAGLIYNPSANGGTLYVNRLEVSGETVSTGTVQYTSFEVLGTDLTPLQIKDGNEDNNTTIFKVEKSGSITTTGSVIYNRGSFNTTLGVLTPSANNSINLPNASGTVALTSQLPSVNNGSLTLNTSGVGLSGSASFTANQSGSSTFTITSNATSANTVSTIVARDASGNFNAGTITATTFVGALTGTASENLTSASTLTAGNLSGTIPSAVLGNSSLFIGTTSVALNRASGTLALTGVTNTNWDTAYTHSQITSGANPHGTTFANIASKPTTIAGYGISDAVTLSGDQTIAGNKIFSNNVTVNGNLFVNGTSTVLNTTELAVEDINIELGKVATPSDATASGGGITLKGTTDKTFAWNSIDGWKSSENITASQFIGNASSANKVNNSLTSGNYLSMNSGTTFDGSADITINHNLTTRNDSSNTATPAFGGTFTAVDSVSTDVSGRGHVIGVNLKTVTIPSLPATMPPSAHPITQHSATAWRMFFSNATTTAVQELAFGTAGTYLRSGGATTNPTWSTIAYSEISGTPTIPTVGNGTLTLSPGVGATNTSVSIGTGTGFSANTSSNLTYTVNTGPALANLASIMTGTSAGFLRKTGQDTYTLDTSTYDNYSSWTIKNTAIDAGETVSSGQDVQILGGTNVTISRTGRNLTINSSFTDTNTATHADGIMKGANSGTQVSYDPYTTQQARLSFDTSATNPTRTDRLNLNGYLYAKKLFSEGSEVLTAHPAVAAASSSDNSGRTYIQDVILDQFGHVTGLATATETVVDTNTTYSISTEVGDDAYSEKIRLTAGGSGSGTDDVILAVGSTGTSNTYGLTIEETGDTITFKHADTSSQASVDNSGRTYIQDITLDEFGHITGLTSATETVVDTHWTAANFIGASGTQTNAVTTNGNTYLKLVENSTIRSSHLIQGSGATTVASDTSGNITISSTDNDTKNTAGSTDISTKIFLIGASSQAVNPQTYSDDEVFVTNGVLSAKDATLSGNLTAVNTTLSGDIAVNGGDITTTSATFNIGTTATTAQTLNLATAATTVSKILNLGTGGTSGTTTVNINSATGGTTNINGSTSVSSNLSVGGNLTLSGDLVVNGTTTTLNARELTIDDKNIELGSVIGKTGLEATLTAGNSVVLTTGNTSGMIPGQVLVKTSGTGAFGTNARVGTISSSTQFTVVNEAGADLNHSATGSIIFSVQGANNSTANGGGITLAAGADGNKTIVWNSTGTNWTSSENWNLASGKEYRINGTSVLNSTTLGTNIVNSSLTGVGTITSGTWNANWIGTAYGGTGIGGVNPYTQGDILYASNSTTLTTLAKGLAGRVLKMNAGATAPEWAIESDTATHADGIMKGTNSGTQVSYDPYTTNESASATPRLYTTTNIPTGISRLNLAGYFWATRIHSLGIYGGDIAGGNLTIGSTSDLTKGTISLDSNTSITGTLGISGLLTASSGVIINSGTLNFSNSADRSISIVSTSAGTGGRLLELAAGSTSAGGTNVNGGNLVLKSGQSTGSGTSSIIFQTTNINAATTSLNTLSERMSINSTGVTIAGNLTLTGASTLATSTGNLSINTNGGNGNIILTPNGSVGTSAGRILLTSANTGTGENSAVSITDNRNMYISGNLYFPSDERLKDKHEIVSSSILDSVLATDIWKFSYKAKPDQIEIGVMAQELERNFPELAEQLVSTDSTERFEDQKSLKESKLVYVLWAALQEETKKRKELEDKINKIMERLDM